MSPPVRLYAGLMSGTSVDAVDGALVAFPAGAQEARARSDHRSRERRPGHPETLAFRSLPIPPTLREALHALQGPGADELARAALAANQLSELYARVVEALLAAAGCRAADVAAIGAHGQTVRHRPDLGYTLQLLNPALLAERTGIDVVADLRSADVAAHGQGAPLAPGFHAEAFGDSARHRAIVNLGGIANISLIEPGRFAGAPPKVTGFDTGPANTLLDLWCRRHTGAAFDRDGRWAAGGRVLAMLLERMLEEPYFALPAPKSTGRDLFDAQWLDSALHDTGCADAPPRDVQATLAELTAVSAAGPCRSAGAEEVWICGGGARNADLMRRLARLLAPVSVRDTGSLGIDPQAVEAMAFAWLARRRLLALPGNLPAVTGAIGARVLGAVWPAGGAPAASGRER